MNERPMKDSAEKLIQPSAEALSEFSGKSAEISESVSKILSARPDIIKLIGEDNLEMMQNNIRNFTRFMESVFTEYHPEVLAETVKWVMRTYKAHGFSSAFWPAELDVFCQVIQDKLSQKSYEEIYPFYRWITVNIPHALSFIEE